LFGLVGFGSAGLLKTTFTAGGTTIKDRAAALQYA